MTCRPRKAKKLTCTSGLPSLQDRMAAQVPSLEGCSCCTMMAAAPWNATILPLAGLYRLDHSSLLNPKQKYLSGWFCHVPRQPRRSGGNSCRAGMPLCPSLTCSEGAPSARQDMPRSPDLNGEGSVSSPFSMTSEGLPSPSCGVCNKLWNDAQDLVYLNLHCPFVVIVHRTLLHCALGSTLLIGRQSRVLRLSFTLYP